MATLNEGALSHHWKEREKSITFKLDKFIEMQVRAKVNPDPEYSTPLKHRSSVSGCPRT